MQPDGAENQLEYPDGERNEVNLVILQFAIVVQAIAEEEECADDGVHDVIGERHLSHCNEATKQPRENVGLIKQNDC